MMMQPIRTSSPSLQQRLRASAIFCVPMAALLIVSCCETLCAAGAPAPNEPASYHPVDQDLATPASFNRTRRQVRGRAWARPSRHVKELHRSPAAFRPLLTTVVCGKAPLNSSGNGPLLFRCLLFPVRMFRSSVAHADPVHGTSFDGPWTVCEF